MKISRKNNSKKRGIVIAVCVLLIIVAGCVGYLYLANQKSTKLQLETNKDQNTQVTQNTSNSEEREIDTGISEDSSAASKPAMEPEASETDKNDSIATPTILSAKQTDRNHIRISASFTETANGTCKLMLKKVNEDIVTKTVNIIVVPSGYACNGFTVDVPSEGGWTATVTHFYKGLKSQSPTVMVE